MNERRINYLLGEINQSLDNKKSHQNEMSLMEHEHEQAHEREQANKREQQNNNMLAQKRLRDSKTFSRSERYDSALEARQQNIRMKSSRQYQREYSRS
ncbi:MAG: hypothetical protein MJ212_04765 [Alphaproteobacteria bacterium]|nr:hypothetical protein [Alphaproteobacteria bacterium]